MRQLGQARRPLLALLICFVLLTSTLLTPVFAFGATSPVKQSTTGSVSGSKSETNSNSNSDLEETNSDNQTAKPAVSGNPVKPATTGTQSPATASTKSQAKTPVKAPTQAPTQPSAEAPARSGTRPRIQASEADIMLLAHLIQAEAGIEPYLGKVAVGAVVINRMLSNFRTLWRE